MKFTAKFIAIASLTLIVSALSPFYAQAAKTKIQRVNGAVSAVSQSANTITVLDKKTNKTTTVTVTSTTKIVQSKAVELNSLATGDKIRVQSKTDIPAGATTVDAARIELISPVAGTLKAGAKKGNKRSIEGIIVTSMPTLSITDDSGSPVTITTDAKTKILATVPATFDDVTVAKHVQIQGPLVGASVVADEVTISAEKAGKKKK